MPVEQKIALLELEIPLGGFYTYFSLSVFYGQKGNKPCSLAASLLMMHTSSYRFNDWAKSILQAIGIKTNKLPIVTMQQFISQLAENSFDILVQFVKSTAELLAGNLSVYKNPQFMEIVKNFHVYLNKKSPTETLYNVMDYRAQHNIKRFPIIFHYRNGGGDSSVSSRGDNAEKLTYSQLPASVKQTIEKKGIPFLNVEIYRARCELLLYPTINYFTHCWAMDQMIENVLATVESGIFESTNLIAVDGQIGVNSLVSQQLSFHDVEHLSGNVAKCKVVNTSLDSNGWFLSIHNNKAIVVHWIFPAPLLTD